MCLKHFKEYAARDNVTSVNIRYVALDIEQQQRPRVPEDNGGGDLVDDEYQQLSDEDDVDDIYGVIVAQNYLTGENILPGDRITRKR